MPRTATKQVTAEEPAAAPTEYGAKIIEDTGILRARVPSPLLRALGARAGDTVLFRYDQANQAWMVSVKRERQRAPKD